MSQFIGNCNISQQVINPQFQQSSQNPPKFLPLKQDQTILSQQNFVQFSPYQDPYQRQVNKLINSQNISHLYNQCSQKNYYDAKNYFHENKPNHIRANSQNFLQKNENSQENPLKNSIKIDNKIEFIPYEKTVIEYEEVQKTVKQPVEKKVQDYYALETITEYIPYRTYETKTEYVPIQKLEEKIEYKQLTKEIIHYPKDKIEDQKDIINVKESQVEAKESQEQVKECLDEIKNKIEQDNSKPIPLQNITYVKGTQPFIQQRFQGPILNIPQNQLGRIQSQQFSRGIRPIQTGLVSINQPVDPNLLIRSPIKKAKLQKQLKKQIELENEIERKNQTDYNNKSKLLESLII